MQRLEQNKTHTLIFIRQGSLFCVTNNLVSHEGAPPAGVKKRRRAWAVDCLVSFGVVWRYWIEGLSRLDLLDRLIGSFGSTGLGVWGVWGESDKNNNNL